MFSYVRLMSLLQMIYECHAGGAVRPINREALLSWYGSLSERQAQLRHRVEPGTAYDYFRADPDHDGFRDPRIREWAARIDPLG